MKSKKWVASYRKSTYNGKRDKKRGRKNGNDADFKRGIYFFWTVLNCNGNQNEKKWKNS